MERAKLLCTKCKHYHRYNDYGGPTHVCRREARVNLVHGIGLIDEFSCAAERASGARGSRCGYYGQYWEAKDE